MPPANYIHVCLRPWPLAKSAVARSPTIATELSKVNFELIAVIKISCSLGFDKWGTVDLSIAAISTETINFHLLLFSYQ